MTISMSLIYGFMVGFEMVEDGELFHVVIDLGFFRVLFTKE